MKSERIIIQDEVLKHFRSLSFFQALEILRHAGDGVSLRFRATPSLAFPPHEISRAYEEERPNKIPKFTLEIPFLGLYGPASPLPTFYTERLLREESSSHNLRDFLDIFNHALVTRLLDIRGYTRSLIERDTDTAKAQEKRTETTKILLRLGGLVALSEAAKPQQDADTALLLPAIGLMAFRRGTARELRHLVGLIFRQATVEVEEWIPQPINIDEQQLARLGTGSARLGSFLLGRRSVDASGGIRLKLGGLSYQDAMELLPGKAQYARLLRLLRMIVPGGLHVDLLLSVVDGQPMKLGGAGAKLGWTTRLTAAGPMADMPQQIKLSLTV